ncbi:MAG: Lrp/AsnC family transcriptional regulator, partial [bacterium]
MSSLTSDERIVLNNLQGGLPITPRPFEKLSEELGLDEGTILGTLRRLRKNNRLSRFGAVLNTRAMGGDSRLAAVSVPEDSRDQAASVINDYRTVTHNYVRDHDLNLWFVLSARSADRIDSTMGAIEDELGETVFDLPKLTEYYVGLRFKFLEDGSVKTVSVDDDYGHVPEGESNGLSERQRDLILELQDGLPLTKRPYRDLGGQVGFTEQTTMNVLESLLEEGKIKRLGCVPNHYALGIRGNGMVVF